MQRYQISKFRETIFSIGFMYVLWPVNRIIFVVIRKVSLLRRPLCIIFHDTICVSVVNRWILMLSIWFAYICSLLCNVGGFNIKLMLHWKEHHKYCCLSGWVRDFLWASSVCSCSEQTSWSEVPSGVFLFVDCFLFSLHFDFVCMHVYIANNFRDTGDEGLIKNYLNGFNIPNVMINKYYKLK